MLYFYINNNSIIKHLSAGKAEVVEYNHIWRRLDECELFFVTAGELFIKEGNEEFHLKTGDYLITQPKVDYGGYGLSTGTFHWVHFTFDGKEIAFSERKDQEYDHCVPRLGNIKEWDALVVLLVLLEQYSVNPKKRIISNKMNQIVLLELMESVINPSAMASKDKRFQPIMDYFNQNPYYNEFSDVKGMADFFGYSEKYLIRLFKRNTGKSPMQFFIDKKIKRAEEMLSDTNLSVKQIAEMLHYDYYYFMRLFKKRTGVSPTKFRKFVIPNWKSYLS